MNKHLLMVCAISGMFVFHSCKDDEPSMGIPSIEIEGEVSDACFGDSLSFTFTATDSEVALSSFRAQLLYGEEQVSETMIPVVAHGSYSGKIYVPFEANMTDRKATLKYVLRNVQQVTTEVKREINLTHRDFPYLTLVQENGQEYKMEKTATNYYEISEEFPLKMNAYIKTPKVGTNGNVLNFGWRGEAVGLIEEYEEISYIPISNGAAGKYTVSFDTYSWVIAPQQAGPQINGEDMEAMPDGTLGIVLDLTQGQYLSTKGLSDEEYWIDPDFFRRLPDGLLEFLPVGGRYQLIADETNKYFGVKALDGDSPASLHENGTGAIWVIGTGIGKPSFENASGTDWSLDAKALCMSQIETNKFQLSTTAGITLNTQGVSFRFFKLWDMEGVYKQISVDGDLIEMNEDGIVTLKEGQTFEEGSTYKFIVDVTAGIDNALLTIEKDGEVTPRVPVFDGVEMIENTDGFYQVEKILTQNQTIKVAGISDVQDYYIDPDFFEKIDDNTFKFLAVDGEYRITAVQYNFQKEDRKMKYFRVEALKDGQYATLPDDGIGGTIWIVGYGVGKPIYENVAGWDWWPGTLCMAQIEPKKYQLTVTAGTTLNIVNPDEFDFKFLAQRGWGWEFTGDRLTMGSDATNTCWIMPSGDIQVYDKEYFKRNEGRTYRFTIDVTAGNESAKLIIEDLGVIK